jgi:hypothetical protein
MGPPSYMRSVVDRNVVMRRMTVHIGAEYVEQDGLNPSVTRRLHLYNC